MAQSVLVLASDEFVQSLKATGMTGGALNFVRAPSAEDLLANVAEQPVAAILLHLEAISAKLADLVAQLRADTRAPIVVLADKPDADTVVKVLEGGADECLPAELSSREIITHLRAQIRRAIQYSEPTAETTELLVGPLRIDLARHTVSVDDRSLELPPREFDLLAYLAKNVGRAVPREEIVAQVWQGEISIDSRSLDVHIGRLRSKIESDPQAPTLINTVAGVGYRLDSP